MENISITQEQIEAMDDTLSAVLDYEAHKDKEGALAAGLVQARIGGVK